MGRGWPTLSAEHSSRKPHGAESTADAAVASEPEIRRPFDRFVSAHGVHPYDAARGDDVISGGGVVPGSSAGAIAAHYPWPVGELLQRLPNVDAHVRSR